MNEQIALKGRYYDYPILLMGDWGWSCPPKTFPLVEFSWQVSPGCAGSRRRSGLSPRLCKWGARGSEMWSHLAGATEPGSSGIEGGLSAARAILSPLLAEESWCQSLHRKIEHPLVMCCRFECFCLFVFCYQLIGSPWALSTPSSAHPCIYFWSKSQESYHPYAHSLVFRQP